MSNELSPVPLQRKPWFLSEAIAQGDWYVHCAGAESTRMERTKRRAASQIGHGVEGNYDHSHNEPIGPSEDRRSAIDLAIIREDLSRPDMFLRWVDGKAQVADALTKLHGDGDLLRAVCRQAFAVLVEALRSWLPDVKKGENVKGYRESSHH